MKKYGRDKTVFWFVELFTLHILLLNEVQDAVVVQQILYMTVCEATPFSHNMECSETVEVPQSAVNSQGGQCLCRDAEALSHYSKQRESLSLVESFVRSQIV